MIAGIPAEDRPTIVSQPIPQDLFWRAVGQLQLRAGLTCLSCGAKTDEHGALPCGH